MAGVGGEVERLAVLVDEGDVGVDRPLLVAVEGDVVLELDEPLRLAAVVEREAAVDVEDGAVGRLDDPGLDGPVLEHRLEPDPEVDVVGVADAEGAVAPAGEAVDRDRLAVDLHPAGVGAGLLDVGEVGEDPAPLAGLDREQLPERSDRAVVELPLDAGLVRAQLEQPPLERLDAGPAGRPGRDVVPVVGARAEDVDVPVAAVGQRHLGVAERQLGVRVVAPARHDEHRVVGGVEVEVAAVGPVRCESLTSSNGRGSWWVNCSSCALYGMCVPSSIGRSAVPHASGTTSSLNLDVEIDLRPPPMERLRRSEAPQRVQRLFGRHLATRAAVDQQVGAGQVAGLVARAEGEHLGDLLDLPEAAAGQSARRARRPRGSSRADPSRCRTSRARPTRHGRPSRRAVSPAASTTRSRSSC